MSFKPNWASSPGDTIIDILNEKSITIESFSKQMGFDLEYCNRFLKGEERITKKIALMLSNNLGASQAFWIKRDRQYVKDLKRISK